ncbi:MAG: peptidoglycan bridge formation glycyltransferase FemA/FemB family protein [Bacteroidales bacterium]|nr:peptidoglycan bridge formation glycyltransferase FemA/FemB family protein [Bacteroidales bacterium]MCF8387048.1 peptidoglycan bridge formation glycyltransferase FemA/FemB family protein [Bacteroidales bacterium]MCF8397679.1 peptidoglycan bridge formation glycyltransferase FemA/FemB family protein [Bacteroidales bacterium]
MQSSLPVYTIYNDPVFSGFIAEYFDWKYRMGLIREGEKEIAQLPFVRVGRQWVSVPHGSVIGLGNLSDQFSVGELDGLMSLLVEELENNLSKKQKIIIPLQEIRDALPVMAYKNKKDLCWQVRSFIPFTDNVYRDKVMSLIRPAVDPEEQFALFSSNLRRKIRKAEKNGIMVKTGRQELADDFYEVFSKNMHRLGSPFLRKDFYTRLIKSYPGQKGKIFIAYRGKKPIGASLLLGYKNFWENIYFATLDKFNTLYPSYILQWNMIQYAIGQNADTYSFGRSTFNSGTHQYKKQWGTEDLPLYWNHSHPQGRNIRKFGFLNKIWKKLPYGFCKATGPGLARRVF